MFFDYKIPVPVRVAEYKLITPPAVEPFTVEEAMSFLRVDDESETPLVADLIKVAREYVELHTDRALIQQTWSATFDRWPRFERKIVLAKVPLISVTGITYFDENNVGGTVFSDFYSELGDAATLGFIERNYNAEWPRLYNRSNAITITFKAGYGTTGAAVPASLKHAMKLVISNFYDQRSPVNVGNIVSEMPNNLRALIESYRVGGYVV